MCMSMLPVHTWTDAGQAQKRKRAGQRCLELCNILQLLITLPAEHLPLPLPPQVLIRGEPNISYICSRYYRAPELIFGATDYTAAIDVWSVGCVVAELLLGQPLFPGESGVDQLVEIIKVNLCTCAHIRTHMHNYVWVCKDATPAQNRMTSCMHSHTQTHTRKQTHTHTITRIHTGVGNSHP